MESAFWKRIPPTGPKASLAGPPVFSSDALICTTFWGNESGSGWVYPVNGQIHNAARNVEK
jgi:hypothetical protein